MAALRHEGLSLHWPVQAAYLTRRAVIDPHRPLRLSGHQWLLPEFNSPLHIPQDCGRIGNLFGSASLYSSWLADPSGLR
ncbi:hypothetical protein OKW43_007777 [Paraburkholderia sp. WC7.3g]